MSALKNVGTSAMSAFKNINWGAVGKAVVQGIANGITGGARAIVNAAKNAAKSALDAAKNFLGIHSPSRVFRDEVGKNMALGIGVGFEKNMPVKDMNQELKDAVKKIDAGALNSVMDSMMRSLQLEASGSVSISRTNAVEKANVREDDKREDQELMEAIWALTKVAARPVEAHLNVGGREIAKAVAEPMAEELDQLDALKKMLRGVR